MMTEKRRFQIYYQALNGTKGPVKSDTAEEAKFRKEMEASIADADKRKVVTSPPA